MTVAFRATTVAVYLGLIVGTNVAFAAIGPAPTTFVLAGLTLAARDFVHESVGRAGSFTLVLVGAGVSAVLAAPAVALASLVAFLVAESADLLVYDWVRAKAGQVPGVLTSGLLGSVADSVIFLSIAFGSLAFFEAQVVGKLAATAGAAALLLIVRGGRSLAPA